MSSHRLLRDWTHCDTERSEEDGDRATRKKEIVHWKSNTADVAVEAATCVGDWGKKQSSRTQETKTASLNRYLFCCSVTFSYTTVVLIVQHILFDHLFLSHYYPAASCYFCFFITDWSFSYFEYFYVWHFHIGLCTIQLFRRKNYTYFEIAFI